jgi:hypothetical protein
MSEIPDEFLIPGDPALSAACYRMALEREAREARVRVPPSFGRGTELEMA